MKCGEYNMSKIQFSVICSFKNNSTIDELINILNADYSTFGMKIFDYKYIQNYQNKAKELCKVFPNLNEEYLLTKPNMLFDKIIFKINIDETYKPLYSFSCDLFGPIFAQNRKLIDLSSIPKEEVIDI